MKVQSVKNHTVIMPNYQTNKTNQQSKMLNQQSFGNLILDERGIELMSSGLQKTIRMVFNDIKVIKSISNFQESKEIDVLVHPFQDKGGSGGVSIVCPRKKGFISRCFYWDHDLWTSRGIIGHIRESLSPSTKRLENDSTNFEEFAKVSNWSDAFWNVEKPLPENVLIDRFEANLSIPI